MDRVIENDDELISMFTSGDSNLKDAVKQKIEDSKLVRCLIALRSKSGLSQVELACKIGCSQRHISKMEHGTDSNLLFGDVLKYVQCTGHSLIMEISSIDEQ